MLAKSAIQLGWIIPKLSATTGDTFDDFFFWKLDTLNQSTLLWTWMTAAFYLTPAYISLMRFSSSKIFTNWTKLLKISSFLQGAFENISIKDRCLAFKEGCPYRTKFADEPFMKELLKCPEFKGDCPFKKATNIKGMFEEMSKIPAFTPDHQKWLTEMFKGLHSASKGLEKELGRECPVFKTNAGCPFKSVKKDGKLLVEPADSVLMWWDWIVLFGGKLKT